MCSISVAAAGAVSTQEPAFAKTFETHIMDGAKSGKSHVGLHSLNRLLGDKKTYKKTEPVRDATCSAIYAAKVNIYGEEKLSAFFPDEMCFAHIKEAVTLAWKNGKAGLEGTGALPTEKSGAITSFQLSMPAGSEKVAWAGSVQLTIKRSVYTVWIGGQGTGKSSNPIETAFPAVGHKFF